ncbi:MAG: helix-turn-helix domain-containing protein [Pyrinomonadaceae bacterium]
MRITSQKLQTSHVTANEEALLRCETALELKDKGDYQGARQAMGPLWCGLGQRPETGHLYSTVAAEVLLCTGILTRWIGSKEQVSESQYIARDLISESITFYESAGDFKKVAAARAELAYCYWREGALDEARIMFNEALKRLTTEGNTRANALLGLAVVEWSDARFTEALRILTDNVSLFNRITNHATKGAYHSQLAMVLRKLAPLEKRDDYFKRVLKEYEEADHHFKLAHNIVFRADVKNNIGNLCRELFRFKEAHEHLQQARRLRAGAKDKVGIAQIDDTRAQVLIAEKKYKEAEAVARSAVHVLEKSGHQCLLAATLITHGIALARLKQTERAQFTLQRAIEVAHQVGALNKAGLATLTMIEELDELSPDTLCAAYDRASEWLSKSQSPDLLLRLNLAARKIFSTVRAEPKPDDATEAVFNQTCDLQHEVLKFEGGLIRHALAQANGSVTRAASRLKMSYQALAYVIESRHKDLLKERSPIRRRSRRNQEAERRG